ncbi:MAG: putative RDD family membrane protein YckC [Gammaproteobacteria bacterium]|jgi:uncharacterized RDD family membrane protein YckC
MASNFPEQPTAGPLKRLAAMVYDSLLLFGVLFTATLIPSLILDKSTKPQMENEQVLHELSPLMTGFSFQIYLLAVTVLFFCWFWKTSGQTLGMQAWRLKLEDYDGQTPTILQCVVRLVAAFFSLLCLGAGYWWIWIDKDAMSWHDRLSKTRIIVLPKESKAAKKH